MGGETVIQRNDDETGCLRRLNPKRTNLSIFGCPTRNTDFTGMFLDNLSEKRDDEAVVPSDSVE